jgi:hypothetical protein
MKHECGLCLRDNKICKTGYSFFQLLIGVNKIKECMIYDDYHKGLEKQKKIKDKNKNKEALRRLKVAV